MADYTGSDRRLAYLFANGGGGGGSCKVISGYYHDGDFYEDQSYTQIITGDTECLYIDLDTTTLYLFDGTDYVEVQGGGGGTGGRGFSSDTLFSGEYYDESTSQLLSANYTDYDYLLVEGCAKASYYHSKNTILIQVSDIDGSSAIGGEFAIGMINPLNSSFFWWMRFSFTDGTHIKISDKNLGGWTGDSPMITKVLGLKSISKHTYSTTEQVVGTWHNGKPLYEICTTFTRVVVNGGAYDRQFIQLPSADMEIKDAKVMDEANGYSHYCCSIGNSDVSGYVYLRNNSSTAIGIDGIIFRYTKSTD